MGDPNRPQRYNSHHQRSSSTGSHGLLFGIGAAAGPHHVVNHHHLIPHQRAKNFSPEILSDDDVDVDSEVAADDGSFDARNFPDLRGTLSKWTNYMYGWQDRFIAVKDGTLVYYKSETETDFGCRGAISIDKATITLHDLDDFRFDVSASTDCVWYLRAATVEDRQRWVETLETVKKFFASIPGCGGGSAAHHLYNSSHDLVAGRHDSALSLTSTASLRRPNQFHEKMAEIETFKDILTQQIDQLGTYIDKVASGAAIVTAGEQPVGDVEVDAKRSPAKRELGEALSSHDFKSEAITFKATANGILFSLAQCIEAFGQREDQWKKRVDKEVAARKRAEDKYRKAVADANAAKAESPPKSKIVISPDFEEGPNSQIGEEEFFDAVETELDRMQEEQKYRDKLKLISKKSDEPHAISEVSNHPLSPIIHKVTKEQLHYARLQVGEESVWELFAEDGEMRLYKREEEVDGMVVDPLKALHQVRGVTARELCHYFFVPEVRMDWDVTVEQVTVLERMSDDTVVCLQLHKRIWPAAQRDALFWSHMRRIDDGADDDRSATWMVCNQSTKHPDAPENQGGCLRVGLTVCFVCDTSIDPPYTLETAGREHITTRITYCSVINPGGWAPASALRAIYKREYPRFLKRFTKYVDETSKHKPVMW